jgi:hypothetical protein
VILDLLRQDVKRLTDRLQGLAFSYSLLETKVNMVQRLVDESAGRTTHIEVSDLRRVLLTHVENHPH